ncbi:MAG: hypothetical protein J0H57_15655 [Rhodospirillales bacterium]|nr:hypothetical protein [Rhodospirillales bacterium]
MRRFALLGLVLLLPGCTGFADFMGDTMTYGTNPNAPANPANTYPDNRSYNGQSTTGTGTGTSTGTGSNAPR